MDTIFTGFGLRKEPKKFLAVFAIILLFSIFSVCFLGTQKAHAIIALNPDPGAGIDPGLRNYLMNCDSYGQSPAVVQWMGPQGNSTSGTYAASYGQQVFILEYWLAGAVCLSNSAVYDTTVYMANAYSTTPTGSSNMPGALTSIAYTAYPNSYRTPGTYNNNVIAFTYNNGVPITSTQNITFYLDTQIVNHFSNGAYLCVANGASVGAGGYIFCPITTLSFTITFTVPAVDDASCYNYWLNTPVVAGQPFSVTIQMLNTGTTNWDFPLYQLGTTPSLTPNYLGYEDRSGWNPTQVPPGWVGSYTFTRTAPVAPGSYPFQWMMVHEGQAWFGATCGPTIVVPAPAPVDSAGCYNYWLNTAVTAGQPFSVTIQMQNLGNTTWTYPTYQLGTAPGQTSNFLNIDTRSGVNPGVIGPTGVATYTFSVTAPATPGTYPFQWKMIQGATWFGPACGPTIVVSVAMVTVQGTIANAYNNAQKYANVTVTTCVPSAPTAVTNASGSFSFSIPKGTNFCVYIANANLPVGTYQAYVRPWGAGAPLTNYTASCPSFDATVRAPKNYCTLPNPTLGRYDNQIAGTAGIPLGYPADRIGDGLSDPGYDIVLSFPPKLSCKVDNGTPIAGVPNGYKPIFYVTDMGASTDAPVDGGTANFSASGGLNGTSTGTFNALTPRGTDIPVTMTPSSFTISAPTSFSTSGSVSFTGDGISSGFACTTSGVNIYIYPYLKAYGGDVSAGGGFKIGGVCTAPVSGGIYAYASGSGTVFQGASGQLGVMALSNINTFYSASQRTAGNAQPSGLTFANKSGVGDATYHGALGGSGVCITDYFNETKVGTPTSRPNLTSAVSSAPAGTSQASLASAGSIMGGSDETIPKGKQIAVYVDGDVYLNHNITYDTAARTGVADIPFFALIVRGSIFIAPGVTQLDGLYVAQPDAANTRGKIYTCASGLGMLYPGTTIYTNCTAQNLTVNGALIAKQIKFLRTSGNYLAAPTNELPTNFADGTGTGASEVINFTPEMYLAPSPLKDPAAPAASSAYDSIVALPPVY